MAGLSLIKSSADWGQYTQAWAKQHAAIIVGEVGWGNGPTHYPCLAASLIQSQGKIVTCFVYPEQAQTLLQVADGPAPLTEATLGDLELLINQRIHQQLGISIREISANLRAIVEELVEVGITNPERYEKLLAKHLADIDQYMAEATAATGTLADTVTRRILPKEEGGV